MDYIITMDTGDKYLMHHGVVGMKWGKWNAETAARYAGGARSSRTVKMTSKAEKHRMRANEFRAARDSSRNSAMIARAESDRYSDKSARAAQGAELFRNANPKRAAKFERKSAKQDALASSYQQRAADYAKKYAKSDKKAIRYEVKAYKSDANDSSLGPERRTTRDIKKHRISMEQAKARTEAKVREALKNEKLKDKAVEDALNGAREYKKANEDKYKPNNDTLGVTTWKRSSSSANPTGIEVHGFDDSGYTNLSKRLAAMYANDKASKSDKYADTLGEEYIKHLVKHGKRR